MTVTFNLDDKDENGYHIDIELGGYDIPNFRRHEEVCVCCSEETALLFPKQKIEEAKREISEDEGFKEEYKRM